MSNYNYQKKENGKNATGRPEKFSDPKQMEKVANKYFAYCEKNQKPFTVTGLCLALKTSRDTLLEYEAKTQFADTIKRMKLRVENYAEEKLYAENGRQVIGAIFALKNFGWSDKVEINQKRQPTGIMSQEERERARERLRRLCESEEEKEKRKKKDLEIAEQFENTHILQKYALSKPKNDF